MNRFRKIAQDFDKFLKDEPQEDTSGYHAPSFDLERARKADSQGFQYFRRVVRKIYEDTKLVDEWVIEDKWTTDLANTVLRMYQEAAQYNARYKKELMEQAQPEVAPNQVGGQQVPSEKAQSLIDRINQVKNMK